MLKFIRNIFNGLAFGITETIPGVSGGTIAIILGFYFELIEAINNFTKDLRKSLMLVVPLLIGAAAGILLFSSLVYHLLENFSFPTMLFFIGLITGIIPHVFSKIKEKERPFEPIQILLIAIPFALLVIMSFVKRAEPVASYAEAAQAISLPYMIFIFFAGILGAAALVLPGVSGSFVMLLLGVYPFVMFALSSIRVFLGDTSNTVLLFSICKVLVPLGFGIIIGGLGMIRLIEKLLQNHQKIVYTIIFGLLLGSVFALFRQPIVYRSGVSTLIIIAGAATFFAGAAVSFTIGKNRL